MDDLRAIAGDVVVVLYGIFIAGLFSAALFFASYGIYLWFRFLYRLVS